MITTYIQGVNRTDSIDTDSISISEQFQRRATSASFSMFDNKPSEFQNVEIYEHFPVSSLSSTTLILKNKTISGESIWQSDFFRVGDEIILGIGLATEEIVTISSIDSSLNKIVLTSSSVSAHSEDELCGKKIFGGVVTGVSDHNEHTLDNLLFDVDVTDYTKLFDKNLINESYEDRNSLYIINDFVNQFINLNELIEDGEYVDNTALQAEWVETGDGTNPTLDTTDFREGNKAIKLNWTNSGGTATFTASPSGIDVSYLTGVATGTPTSGVLAFWYKQTLHTAVTTIQVKIGSSASDYGSYTFTPASDNIFHYERVDMEDLVITGTPDWASVDYLVFIVTETASSSIVIDGIRVNETGSFTFDGVEESTDFVLFNMRRKRPSNVMQLMADVKGFFWYIDYDKDIKFYEQATNPAVLSLSNNSDNFFDLQISVDADQLVNQQVVHGGLETSTTMYEQEFLGDGQVREWILKNKFKNLSVYVDDNSATDLTEGGTTTTTINATAHGLVAGNYITNRTRSNAVREVLTVPSVDSFTVATVTGQTSGDTFSIFDEKTVGIENITDESSVEYLSNFNEKSVRASTNTTTLTSDGIIKFKYNELNQLSVQGRDNASVTRMKALIGGNGIFEGDPITDISITDANEAMDRARAQLRKFSNPILNASFTTDKHGLSAGQIINIIDTERNLNENFLVQSVNRLISGGDYSRYKVSCASTLFGIIELFQKLLDRNENGNFDEVIVQLENADEIVHTDDAYTTSLDDPGFTWGSDANEGIWSQDQWS